MAYRDTIDKIVRVYLAGLCRAPFTYKGCCFEPLPVLVSPLLLRGFTCPAGCGACCARYSLDYLPGEVPAGDVELRFVAVNERAITILSDMQKDVADDRCRNLNRMSGRCSIYPQRPFACDFELLRIMRLQGKVVVTQKLYGRGWAMTQVTGAKGAQCEMTPPDQHTMDEVERKLCRLLQWATHFDVETCIPIILRWVRSSSCSEPLFINADER